MPPTVKYGLVKIIQWKIWRAEDVLEAGLKQDNSSFHKIDFINSHISPFHLKYFTEQKKTITKNMDPILKEEEAICIFFWYFYSLLFYVVLTKYSQILRRRTTLALPWNMSILIWGTVTFNKTSLKPRHLNLPKKE